MPELPRKYCRARGCFHLVDWETTCFHPPAGRLARAGNRKGWTLRNRRILAAPSGILAVVALSGCIFFPPFFPPDGFLPGDGELVVENGTDTDWVLDVAGMFPMSFAIGAGETGTVPVLADTADAELVLRNADDCEEVHRLDWDGTGAGLAIEHPGVLSVVDTRPSGVTRQFVEYFNCAEGSFIPPEAGEALSEVGGSILIFSTEGAAFALDVTDATLSQLTRDPEFAGSLSLDSYHAWSPDGTRLAYSNEGGGADAAGLYIANPDGSEPELVAEGGRIPRWSPDGTRLAYVVFDPLDDSNRLEVLELSSGTTSVLATEAVDASWSPLGTQLAFVSGSFSNADFEPPADVRVVNADGSGLRTIGETLPFAQPPAWSPDGTWLAFTTAPESGSFLIGSESVVALYDFETDHTRVLASVDGQSVSEPVWSPDGYFVAVVMTGMLGASGSVGLVDMANDRLTELHATPDTQYATPFWSPDGEWLAFTRTTNTSFPADLVAVSRDGSHERVLASRLLIATQWIDAAQ